MDGLSAASSAFAVVSLAVQIGGGIRQLCNFWNSIQDGPAEVRRIIKDLNIVSNILSDIQLDTSSERPHSMALSTSLTALDSCSDCLEALKGMIDELQRGFCSQKRQVRGWAAFKAAWKTDLIQKFKETLSDMKITLILARQNSSNRATMVRDEAQQQELTTIAQGMRLLLQRRAFGSVTTVSTDSLAISEHLTALGEECRRTSATLVNPVAQLGFEKLMDSALSQVSSSLGRGSLIDEDIPPLKVSGIRQTTFQIPATTLANKRRYTRTRCNFTISSVFGTLHLSSAVSDTSRKGSEKDALDLDGASQYEIQTIFTIHPSRWLLMCGISFGIKVVMSKSFQGLECRLKSYRAVPDDALFFEFCQKGDITAIQRLFDERRASPWDTNSKGFTPLFFAARAGKLKTCRLLIAQGADLDARTLSNDTVASYACLKAFGDINSKQCKVHIETLRLFLENLEFSDDINCSGLWGLRRLLVTAKCSHESCSHPPGHPTTFIWALPLLQEQISLALPSMGRGIAQLFDQAMEADDVKSLASLIAMVGDLNSKRIIKWFSPAHEIVMSRHGIRDSGRYLTSHGLDLHVVADEDFKGGIQYKSCAGDTPTSFAMRYSHTFFLSESCFEI